MCTRSSICVNISKLKVLAEGQMDKSEIGDIVMVRRQMHL